MKIWITGASSGIGEALALEYAKRFSHQSCVIALVARRVSQLMVLQARLASQYQVSSVIYALDVCDVDAQKTAAQDFIGRFGAPNIVIASAGVSVGTLTEHAEDLSAFQTVFNTNVMGMVQTFQPFIVPMQQLASSNQIAQLVGIASVAGVRGLPGAGAYSASKAAVISYLESLRVEMAKYGIFVTTIAPGYIKTPMTDVNEYTMPFLMDANVAAKKFADAIEKKRRFVVIPWQMGVVARIMRLISPVIWDRMAKNAPHKKRAKSSPL